MRVYLDSMVWIYHFESADQSGEQARALIQQCRLRRDTLCTSPHILAETLVVPIRKRNDFLVNAYRRVLIATDAVTVLTLGVDAAERFAEIRATTSTRPLDAIHLALASSAQCDLFVTSDVSIQKLSIPGITQIVGMDFKQN